MMNSYVNGLIKSQSVCTMNDKRTIITDRMGSWGKQDVVLTWEGDSDNGIVSITPDEVELLFAKGLIRNVARGENGMLYEKLVYLDIRTFDGAIVCGILAPNTRAHLRQEIFDYAKKMGYVTDKMTPVEMFSGTKSLIFNTDGTYSIFFGWHDSIIKEIQQSLLYKFTSNFFKGQSFEIKNNGVLMTRLSESQVFSRKNIDTFRKYDIQLLYLQPEFDKKLLLRAIMQRAFIQLPCNTLRDGQFEEIGNIAIPEDRQEYLSFNEFGKKDLNCGTVYRNNDFGNEIYTYQITVPYTEYIRELMVDAEKLLKAKYGKKVYVGFLGFNQNIRISCNGETIASDVERELISLDYAMMFLRDESKFNSSQLYYSIISLLESDSSGQFRDEYFSYLKMLKHVLPDKCKFM